MSTTMYECRNCEWQGTEEELEAVIEHVWERMEEGDTYPAGECPECGAFAFSIEPEGTREVREFAQRVLAGPSLEIRSDAKVESWTGGYWVAAWVWVAATDVPAVVVQP